MNCRNCKNTALPNQTLCLNCLKKMDQELMTIEERKARNALLKKEEKRLKVFGAISIVLCLIALVTLHLVLFFILIVASFVFFCMTYKYDVIICPECQRIGTIHEINRELIDQYITTVEKTTKVKREYKSGHTEEYDETREVPAIKKIYDVTYQCEKCGYSKMSQSTRTSEI